MFLLIIFGPQERVEAFLSCSLYQYAWLDSQSKRLKWGIKSQQISKYLSKCMNIFCIISVVLEMSYYQ